MKVGNGFFPAKENTCGDCAEKSGEPKQIPKGRHAEKANANRANQKQGPGAVGKGKKLLCIGEGKLPLLIKLRGQLCSHGVSGKKPEKEGEGGNARQVKQGLHQRAQSRTHPLRRTNAQQDTAGNQKRKQGGEYLCQPELYPFCGSGKHFCGKAKQGKNQKAGTAAQQQSPLFHAIPPIK